jgi:hypothetical protein
MTRHAGRDVHIFLHCPAIDRVKSNESVEFLVAEGGPVSHRGVKEESSIVFLGLREKTMSCAAALSLGCGSFENDHVLCWPGSSSKTMIEDDDSTDEDVFQKTFRFDDDDGAGPDREESSVSSCTDSDDRQSLDDEQPVVEVLLTAEQLLEEEPNQDAVPMTAPDVYGQVHPIETPEIVQQKLAEFDDMVGRLPDRGAAAHVRMAERRCPELLTDEFKLKFLRADVFDTKRSVARYCIHWRKRHAVFGDDGAFKPITLETIKDDLVFLSRGVFHVVERGEDGRSYIFIDSSKFDKTAYTHDNVVRSYWYLIMALLEDEEVCKKGAIMINDVRGFSLHQLDIDLAGAFKDALQGAVPGRLSAFHICHPPSFLRIVFPVISVFLGKRLRKRVLIHGGSEKRTLRQLRATFGFKKEDLPTQLGGTIKLDLKAWLDKRRVEGK